MKFIGIDLGHGETSAAYVSSSEKSVKRLEVSLHKDLVIPTQVMLTCEQIKKLNGTESPDHKLLSELGDIRIGNLPASGAFGERFAYFKKPPKDFGNVSESAKDLNITSGALMACFIHTLVKNIIEANQSELDIEDISEIDLWVGCPSTADWTSGEAVRKYEELIKRAIGGGKVTVVPESRAAMYSSIDNNKSGVISTVDGVAVFDFGSSTADCTYMLLGKTMREFSWALGASQVEMNMCGRVYAEAAESDSFEADSSSLFAVEETLKKAKESYYKELGSPEIVCSFVDKKSGKKISRVVEVNKDFVDKAVAEDCFDVRCRSTHTKTGSWKSLCREYFNEAKADFERDRLPVKTIVLTGGASRMDFVRSICEEIFPDTYIHVESNPSYTVSNGLGWVGLTEQRLPEMISEAIDYVNMNMAEKDCSPDALKCSIKNRLFEYIAPKMLECAERWSIAGDDLTLEDLSGMISENLSKEEIKNISVSVEEEWRDLLMELIGTAVNLQILGLYPQSISQELMLTKDVREKITSYVADESDFNPEGLLGKIKIPNVLKIMGNVVSYVALGLLSLINPWIGIPILVGCAFGDLTAETSADMKKPLPAKQRKKIFQRLEQKFKDDKYEVKQELMKSLDEEIDGLYKEFPKILNDMISLTLDIVTMRYFEKNISD